MQDREIKLSVNDLRISFRTDGGKVQAVRNVCFDLYKGETLAIVGESGSGKSVTNRAVMGILAGNAVKEGGEIIYDGQDLMKIGEEEFHKLRGDKIAMIFQDPMSSLNPIMRVGKQLTEAMILKGRISQKESRRDFNAMLAQINRCMDEARGARENYALKEENKRKCAEFDRFEYKHLDLEYAYNKAREAAEDALAELDDVLFRIEKGAFEGWGRDVDGILRYASGSCGKYVVDTRAEELKGLLKEVRASVAVPVRRRFVSVVRRLFGGREKETDGTAADFEKAAVALKKIKEILSEATAKSKPDFFAMGYYETFSEQPLPELEIVELNAFLRKYLDDHFMLDFIRLAEEGVRYSHRRSLENKKAALALIEAELPVFQDSELDKRRVKESSERLIKAIDGAIDRLETVKDNLLYTFRSSLHAATELYFAAEKGNRLEEKRYARQKRRYDKKTANGKTPGYEISEKNLIDREQAKKDIVNIIQRIKRRFEYAVKEAETPDFRAKTVALIDYLKEKASGVVYRVTRGMAKIRALKLLKEVGIPDPAKRFKQYPFEFSGGMRQRIVIAIALSADPDILICDEPTTALDVTIQAQILELINKVKAERGLSVIFITHDLGVVANMADRVAVMYAGKIVEIGTAEDVFYEPAHPYTWALLSSMPDLETKEKLEAIPGTPPNMIYPPKGDAFAERNQYALQIDFERQPPMFAISDTHFAATWLLHPSAPRVSPPKSVADRIARMKAARRNSDGKQEC